MEFRVEVPQWKATRESTIAGLGEDDWKIGEELLRYGWNKGTQGSSWAGNLWCWWILMQLYH